MVLCSNCEFAFATAECDTCKNASQNSLFCDTCRSLHCEIEENRRHVFSEIVQRSSSCSNCEFSASKFYCLDCPVRDQNYCLGCSIFHPKVKATRNHRIVCYESEGVFAPALSSVSLLQKARIFCRDLSTVTPVAEFLEVLQFFEAPSVNISFIFMALLFIAGLALLLFARRVIGKNGSSFLTIVGTVCLLRFLQTRPKATTTRNFVVN